MRETIPLRPTIAGVEIPVACDLNAIPADERKQHLALSEQLFGKLARERLNEATSAAFRFDADAYAQVTQFVENERRCCAFLTFAIVVHPGGGPVWLRVWGDDAARGELLTMAVNADLNKTDPDKTDPDKTDPDKTDPDKTTLFE